MARLTNVASDHPLPRSHLGLIDVLQTWTWGKWVESVTKRYLCCSGRGISAVPPSAYYARFMERVVNQLVSTGARDADLASPSLTPLQSPPV